MRGATHVVVFDAAGRNLLRTKLVGITEGFERPSRPLTMSRAALAAAMSILVLALVFVTVNLTVDLIQSLLDPRIRRG